MTIMEALGTVDSLKHNTYGVTDKVGWLNRLDGLVKEQVIDTHEGGEDVGFAGYTAATPMTTVLLAPAPYDEIYVRWLEAQIDYHNGEINLYNESITLFNAAWSRFESWYNRTHMPKGRQLKYF